MKKLITLFLFLGLYAPICDARIGSGKFKFKNRTPWDIKVTYGDIRLATKGLLKDVFTTERIKAGRNGKKHNWRLRTARLQELEVKSPIIGWTTIQGIGHRKITGNPKIETIENSETFFSFSFKNKHSTQIPKSFFYPVNIEQETPRSRNTTAWTILDYDYKLIGISQKWGLWENGFLYYYDNTFIRCTPQFKIKKFGATNYSESLYFIAKDKTSYEPFDKQTSRSKTTTIEIEEDQAYMKDNIVTLDAVSPLGNLKVKALAYPYAIGLDGKCYKVKSPSEIPADNTTWELFGPERDDLIDIAYFKNNGTEHVAVLDTNGIFLEFDQERKQWLTICKYGFKEIHIGLSSSDSSTYTFWAISSDGNYPFKLNAESNTFEKKGTTPVKSLGQPFPESKSQCFAIPESTGNPYYIV
jgi:hypothetical protein